jgi:hypothetical protein
VAAYCLLQLRAQVISFWAKRPASDSKGHENMKTCSTYGWELFRQIPVILGGFSQSDISERRIRRPSQGSPELWKIRLEQVELGGAWWNRKTWKQYRSNRVAKLSHGPDRPSFGSSGCQSEPLAHTVVEQTIESCMIYERTWFLSYDPPACASSLIVPTNSGSFWPLTKWESTIYAVLLILKGG